MVAARFAAIWLASKVTGEQLIRGCLFTAAAAIATGFLVAPALAPPDAPPPPWVLWVATVLYGAGCGPMFAACNSLPAQHGVRVTATQMTILQLGVSAGNTLGPFLTSRLFETSFGIGCLPWAVLFCLGMSGAALVSLQVCIKRK